MRLDKKRGNFILGRRENMEEQRIKDGMKECMVCHNFTLPKKSKFEICEICKWQNDEVAHDNPDEPSGGPNEMSLNEARKAWREGRPIK